MKVRRQKNQKSNGQMVQSQWSLDQPMWENQLFADYYLIMEFEWAVGLFL